MKSFLKRHHKETKINHRENIFAMQIPNKQRVPRRSQELQMQAQGRSAVPGTNLLLLGSKLMLAPPIQ